MCSSTFYLTNDVKRLNRRSAGKHPLHKLPCMEVSEDRWHSYCLLKENWKHLCCRVRCRKTSQKWEFFEKRNDLSLSEEPVGKRLKYLTNCVLISSGKKPVSKACWRRSISNVNFFGKWSSSVVKANLHDSREMISTNTDRTNKPRVYTLPKLSRLWMGFRRHVCSWLDLSQTEMKH